MNLVFDVFFWSANRSTSRSLSEWNFRIVSRPSGQVFRAGCQAKVCHVRKKHSSSLIEMPANGLAQLMTSVWVVMSVAVGVGCLKVDSAATPHLLVVAGASNHNFGECRQHAELKHTFVLRNIGHSRVRIERFVTSCHCVSGTASAMLVNPGNTVEVSVSLATGSAQDSIAGRVAVLYHDLNKPIANEVINLHLRGHVALDYELSRREINFGLVDTLSGGPVTTTVSLSARRPNDRIEIIDVRSTNPAFVVRVLPNPGHSPYELEVSLETESLEVSQFLKGMIVLNTSSEICPRVCIVVRAEYAAPVETTPNILVVQSNEEGVKARNLRINTSRPSKLVSVISRETSVIPLLFDHQSLSGSHLVRINIAPCEGGDLSAGVTLKVALRATENGQPFVRSVTVPIYRFCRERDE